MSVKTIIASITILINIILLVGVITRIIKNSDDCAASR